MALETSRDYGSDRHNSEVELSHPRVYQFGVTRLELATQPAYVATDGSIPIEAQLVRSHLGSKRFFYRSADSLRGAVRKAPAGEGVIPLLIRVGDRGTNGWQLISPGDTYHDTEYSELPVQFALGALVYSLDQPFPYDVSGSTVHLRFKGVVGLAGDREAWSTTHVYNSSGLQTSMPDTLWRCRKRAADLAAKFPVNFA
jgi:hypothetical protein